MPTLLYPNLGPPAYITASVAPIYTNPAATTTYIRGIHYHNTDTVARTVITYEVPASGGAVGNYTASEEFYKVVLGAGQSHVHEITGPGWTLENVNDTIQAICDVASKVTVKFLGSKLA